MANNLPDNLKTNWVDNETVMPVNVNGWSSAINKIKDAVPVYSANGNFYTATYGSNIYSLSPITMNGETNVPPSAYIDGMKVVFKCPTNNSANCSVNVNSLGNKSIKNLDGSNIGAGVLVAGNYIELIYDNSQGYFKLLTAHYLPISSVAGKGSASLPVYFDADGKAQTITSYEGNSATATKANQDANGDVIDVTYAKNENLFDKMNQSKAMETGSVSYVQEVLQDVIKYKNSSFDLSKFTLVGSPNITDDGILYNTSSNKNVRINNAMTMGNNWSLEEVFYTGDVWNAVGYTNGSGTFDSDGAPFIFGLSATEGKIARIELLLDVNGTVTSKMMIYEGASNMTVGNWYRLKYSQTYNGVAYTHSFKIYNINDILVDSFIKDGSVDSDYNYPIASNRNFAFGCYNKGFAGIGNAKLDLKSIRIISDDEEVFNGHQEGIDTLKPDDFTTVTTIFAYKFGDNTVYSNVINNTNPTELYNADGSYYLGTAFDIINDKVTYPEQATRGADDITIEGVTYYEFEHTTGGSSVSIWADDPTTPTTLYNQDGSEYTGTQWNIMSGKVYYLNDATYTSSANITINRDYNTVDAGVKISEDGIAGNFSTYRTMIVKKEIINQLIGKSFVIEWEATFHQYTSTLSWYVLGKPAWNNTSDGWSGQTIHIGHINTSGNFFFLISGDSGNTPSVFIPNSLVASCSHLKYRGKAEFNGSNYMKLTLSFEDGTVFTIDKTFETNITMATSTVNTTINAYNEGTYFDLNSFKIYADKKLIYQPMLKIPYIQSASKYGSKIVKEKYRNRVEDAYAQGFEQKYFTLQDNSKVNIHKVNNPEITSDGMCQCSASNYVEGPLLADFQNKSWTIYNCIVNPLEHNWRTDTICQYNVRGSVVGSVTGGNLHLGMFGIFGVSGDATGEGAGITSINIGHDFTTLHTKWDFNYNTGVYSLYYKKDGLGDWVLLNTYTPPTTNKQLYDINMGHYSTHYRWMPGFMSNTESPKIDLKYYRVDINGETVCKPYVQPNFTLPLGELYGLIESKVPKTSLSEVICIVEDYTYEDASAFCWDLSNGIRIQGATQTVSANGEMTVPLLKNFADNHYLAFKNYSAGVSSAMQDAEGSIFDKTTSSFKTSNSTGDTTHFDWIAIGKIG